MGGCSWMERPGAGPPGWRASCRGGGTGWKGSARCGAHGPKSLARSAGGHTSTGVTASLVVASPRKPPAGVSLGPCLSSCIHATPLRAQGRWRRAGPGHPGVAWMEELWGLVLPRPLVTLTVTLDVMSVPGGRAASPWASGCCERRGTIADPWERGHPVTLVPLGSPRLLTSFPLCSRLEPGARPGSRTRAEWERCK